MCGCTCVGAVKAGIHVLSLSPGPDLGEALSSNVGSAWSGGKKPQGLPGP